MKKFEISLAAWSLHRAWRAGAIQQIDLPRICREDFDLNGLELVSSMFPSPHARYLGELKKQAADHGVRLLLIMIDHEGDLSHADPAARRQAVRNHRKWLDIAQVLECPAVRVNTGGQPGDPAAVAHCAESMAGLVELARPDKTRVLIENHWGLSQDTDAMVEVVKRVNDPLLGTLPDFGNFDEKVDRYAAVAKMMPHAGAVSAKCHAFDAEGNHVGTDYARMMKIVLDSGYKGWVGIEYEGPDSDERAGVRACKRLLERFQ